MYYNFIIKVFWNHSSQRVEKQRLKEKSPLLQGKNMLQSRTLFWKSALRVSSTIIIQAFKYFKTNAA